MTGGVFIDPPTPTLLGDRFFGESRGKLHSSLARCLTHVRDVFNAARIPMHTADLLPPPAAGVRHLYVSICNRSNYTRLAVERPDVTLAAMMVTEAPVVDPMLYRQLGAASRRFKRIYSCVDGPELDEYAGEHIDCVPLRWPIDFDGIDATRWTKADRGFLVMINMNKLPRLKTRELFTERMRAVQALSRSHAIDLYGVGWNGPSAHMGRSHLPYIVQRIWREGERVWDRVAPDPRLTAARMVYKGELESKWDVLSNYDFVLCFENTNVRGWLTEKLFEALRVGTIPIYWGASNIAELVTPEAYIDMRRFSGYDELLAYLRGMSDGEKQAYREAGREFLESASFTPFSKEAFADIFIDLAQRYLGANVALPAPATFDASS